MQTLHQIEAQRVAAAYLAHNTNDVQERQVALRTIYSLNIARMMLTGNLEELPIVE